MQTAKQCQGCSRTWGQQCRAGKVTQTPAISFVCCATRWYGFFWIKTDTSFYRFSLPGGRLSCANSMLGELSYSYRNIALSSWWRCPWRSQGLPAPSGTHTVVGNLFSWYCHCWGFWASRWLKVLFKIQYFGLEYPVLTLNLCVTWIWLNWIQCL